MKFDIKGSKVIDLSQTLEPDIPRPIGFPNPELKFLKRIDEGAVINVERFTLGLHSGTHIDAPIHFFDGEASIDEIPPECIIGSAVVVDLRHMKNSVPIEKADVVAWEKKTGDEIKQGDAVLLMTDFSKLWKNGEEGDAFINSGWPYVTKSLADYFLEKKIRLVGVESMDLDLVDPFDLSTSDFVGHRTFLSNGIYIIENLTNLDKIGSNRCSIIATPLKIKGGTGSPVRVIAVV